MSRFCLPLALSLVWPLATLAAPKAGPGGVELFEKKIRPVLVEHCYKCHSADARSKKKLRGGLYLDSRAGLLTGGDSGPAIVPGKAKESLLYKSLTHEGETRMPPKGKLPDSVIRDFEEWINSGAPDPRTGGKAARQKGLSVEEGRKFWAYRPLERPAVPGGPGDRWADNALDRFILAAMREKGLKPAPEADRATLARRLYFDLAGLAPTPGQIDEFVNDNRPDAYERLVDRLLASPRFGERWGRHWLDVARYAESLTLRGFVLKDAWRYRDYVIDSFDADVPVNRFIREQIAGDLLPAGSAEQKGRQIIATTYLAMGNNNLEDQDKANLRMDVVDEQLDTIGRSLLAQTIACARCHDHKFDPIPTKDYYGLAGILRNVKTLKHANVSMWLEVPLPADPQAEKLLRAHEKAVAELQEKIKALKGAVARKSKPLDPKMPKVRAVESLPGIVVDDAKAKKVGEWKNSTFSGTYVGKGYAHDNDSGKGEKSLTFAPAIPADGKYEVWFAYSPGANRCPRVPITVFSADGEKKVYLDQRKAPDIHRLFVSLGQYRFEKDGQSFVLVSNEKTKGHVIADAVVFIPVEKLGKAPPPPPGPAPRSGPEAGRLREMEARLKKLVSAGPKRATALSVAEEARIEDAHIHIRGNVHNLGARVPRGFLQVATRGEMPKLPTDQSGRVQLADWAASDDNPLTPRVFANRAWHWLLGSGIVRTVDNFGTTGEAPSHPELLDHLAGQFIRGGWSAKRLVRHIVLSRTYRQSSAPSARARKVDPENRLFSHANRRRLDAECIRDTMLQVSGQLDSTRGGPNYRAGLANDYGFEHTSARRSVYLPAFRNSLPEILEAFDFANPSVSTGRRDTSTVVPQALFMMNHPFPREQSLLAAKRLLATGASDEALITTAYRMALGRKPTAAERELVLGYVKAGGPSEREKTWAKAIQVLFASMDFRHVE